MTKHEHQLQGVLRTEPSPQQYQLAHNRLAERGMMRILHACMGIMTESGELMDQVKKHVFYGKPLDRVNCFEEGGDLEWYAILLSQCLKDIAGDKCPFDEMIDRMLEKLRKRYPEKFTEQNAIERNLEAERLVLEGVNPLLPDPPHRLPSPDEYAKPVSAYPVVQFVCINPECDGREAHHTPSGYVCVKCGAGQ